MHNEEYDTIDFQNFKGLYYNTSEDKYIDSQTGAHFHYQDLCNRLAAVAEKRNKLESRAHVLTLTVQKPIQNPHKKVSHIRLKDIATQKQILLSPKSRAIKFKEPTKQKQTNTIKPTCQNICFDTYRRSVQIYKKSPTKKKLSSNLKSINTDLFHFKSMDLRKPNDIINIVSPKVSAFSPTSKLKKGNKMIGYLSRNKTNAMEIPLQCSNPATTTYRNHKTVGFDRYI